MMTFGTFVAYLADNAARLPRGPLAEAKREAMERLKARLAAGRADGPLDFLDLWEGLERHLAGGV